MKWILSLQLDFHGDSAFASTSLHSQTEVSADVLVVSKSLALFNILVDCLDLRFLPLADQYINLFLDNANTGYAEVSRMLFTLRS